MRPILLAAAAALGGCSFAPPYRPPTVATPAAYKEAGAWTPAAPGAIAAGEWWRGYGDETLNLLEARIASANPGLAVALARYDQAQADLVRIGAGRVPSAGIDVDVSRNRQSDNRPLRGQNQPDIYSADTIEVGAGFELDLWGRVRNAVAARRAETEASADDVAGVRLSLQSRLAAAYVTLRGLDQRIALLTATVDAYDKADAMTKRRFAAGIASGLDVSRAGAQRAEAQARLFDARAGRALAEHAIASLVGTPAPDFSVTPSVASLELPPVPAGVPAALLERRPDIAAAERRMAAANAEIGVAKAAFFPAITLGGGVGFQNTGMDGLLSAPNLIWSVGPGAVFNLFDGGRRRGGLALARARWREATARYRAAVLQAFEEVENGLALLHHLDGEALAQDDAVRQATQTEALSMNRYVKGAVDYLDVVTAQTTALRTRLDALDLQTRRLKASIQLNAALGGGWHDAG
ncbi:efflux transporter outer membrane subunit [Sphingomonas quercus]|uniref:Efflux transporter outer membrane subunit n=1 Tax=Sphingomonas quercus TaxID=2842451 RepID=A0ABS6BIZ8_9SPHN|nr:efflux transporter outer membrane subunit [Sphingomonas quercus]MBU3077587.1 efflux transporter outer membrane subunit [Sphingomonas quercus]